MLDATLLQPGAALACLPQQRRQPLSQFPSLTQWSVNLTQRGRTDSRAGSTVAKAAVQDQVVMDLPVTQPTVETAQRHRPVPSTRRLQSSITDGQGRLMLKNLTKAELFDWVQQQGDLPAWYTIVAAASTTVCQKLPSRSAGLSCPVQMIDLPSVLAPVQTA